MPKLSNEDKELRDSIKKRFLTILEEKKMSKSDLANLSDKDRQAINKWTNLNNEDGLTIYTIKNLCRILKISLTAFFNDKSFNNYTK
ncbi:helix-turn-helix transcriptional regulator [Empedobacter tilapiae]|uniref:helix-turn-helix transcriptional regulator n=1 Tax=Empedobacter tilapiae TaxID=2491114 RepID=UPI0028D28DA4|nr:helix-turn-helix transcriptional regulator [Empedobacter tilapiae]